MQQKMFRPLALSLIAGGLGFILNCFPVTIVEARPITFGGVFGWVVIILCGPWYGLLTTVITALPVMLAWHSPVPMLMLSLEAITVGWLVRKKMTPLVADLFYWVGIGIPLATLISFVLLKLPAPENLAIVIQAPFNRLLNLLLAELLLTFIPLQRLIELASEMRPQEPSLRYQIWKGFVFFTTIPLLLLTILIGHRESRQQEAEAAHRLQNASGAIAREVDNYLIKHEQALVMLARTIEETQSYDAAQINRLLEQHHANYQGWITMLATDAEGKMMAGSLHRRSDGQAVPLSNVSDRAYFRQPKTTGQSFISDVFPGRGFGTDPIVAISCPIFRDGQFQGIVEGSLNLLKFQEFGQSYQAIREAAIIVTDQEQRVIYASQGYQPLQSLRASPLMEAAERDLAKPSFSYIAEKQEWLVSSTFIPKTNWRVIIQQPMAEVRSGIQRFYLTMLSARCNSKKFVRR